MSKASVLIVDDELKIRRILQIMLESENYKTEQAKDGVEALGKMEKSTYGKCENCGKDIPMERLQVNPSAKTCLNC